MSRKHGSPLSQNTSVDRYTVSVKVAAQMTSICGTRIFAAIRSGELKSLKVGKSRLIRVADLHAWIDSFAVQDPDSVTTYDRNGRPIEIAGPGMARSITSVNVV